MHRIGRILSVNKNWNRANLHMFWYLVAKISIFIYFLEKDKMLYLLYFLALKRYAYEFLWITKVAVFCIFINLAVATLYSAHLPWSF